MNAVKSIDIFCAVVDNFGDIGVCWRLARQMAHEYHVKTRLYVDNRQAFETIVPVPDASVEIHDWVVPTHYQAADIVIEAFACTLPDGVIPSMVKEKSVWIDLEYLTAEDWALSNHAIPSPHPTLPITKTLFFPGFESKSGGLLRENDLISRRNAFLDDKNAQNQWRKAHYLPEIHENCLDISLFCYKTAPINELLAGLDGLNRKIRIFKPVPKSLTPILSQGEREFKNVEIITIPFLAQYDYDYLLWTCDLNFVRGEDSFVRAQYAGKPFFWNIYVQDENAHLVKLHAFLEKIKPFYDAESFERLAILHDLWNEGGRNTGKNTSELWAKALGSLDGLRSGAQNWTNYLINQSNLATRLLAFAATQIKK